MADAYKCTIYRANDAAELLATKRTATSIDTLGVTASSTDEARRLVRAKLRSMGFTLNALNFTPTAPRTMIAYVTKGPKK